MADANTEAKRAALDTAHRNLTSAGAAHDVALEALRARRAELAAIPVDAAAHADAAISAAKAEATYNAAHQARELAEKNRAQALAALDLAAKQAP